MSQINDALKRASQSDKSRPAQAPLPLPMQPVTPPPRGGNLAAWLLAAIVLAVLGLAVSSWLFMTARTRAHPKVAAAPVPVSKPPVAQATSPARQPSPVVQKNLQPPPKSAPRPAIVASPVPTPRVAPPETFPTNLTVKAIFYSKSNPRALVNGRTVETGDKIGDVLVTGIMSDRIFFDWKGQSKVLMMGGQ